MYDSENILKVFTAFSGYDSQCMALDRLGIPYDLVGWSEIDRFAIQAPDAVYPQWSGRNFGDISKIDWTDVPDFDLFTYRFPCTDISIAGKQDGLAEGGGTRSSLLWECRKTIEVKRPRYLLMENVKNLVSKKFMPFFREWERYLAGLGYINFYKVMNAKDYGVPQNRERVFLVSILDEDAAFHFPEPFTLERRLKDVLETDIDERYYLKKGTLEFLLKHSMKRYRKGNGIESRLLYEDSEVGHTVTTYASTAVTDNMIAEPVIMQKCRGFNKGGIHKVCPAVTSNSFEYNNMVIEISNIRQAGPIVLLNGLAYRIRKLTPRENFRLMDVSEDNIDRIQKSGISNSQQYKMAGNSIVVACLYYIFRNLFIDTGKEGVLF